MLWWSNGGAMVELGGGGRLSCLVEVVVVLAR